MTSRRRVPRMLSGPAVPVAVTRWWKHRSVVACPVGDEPTVDAGDGAVGVAVGVAGDAAVDSASLGASAGPVTDRPLEGPEGGPEQLTRTRSRPAITQPAPAMRLSRPRIRPLSVCSRIAGDSGHDQARADVGEYAPSTGWLHSGSWRTRREVSNPRVMADVPAEPIVGISGRKALRSWSCEARCRCQDTDKDPALGLAHPFSCSSRAFLDDLNLVCTEEVAPSRSTAGRNRQGPRPRLP